MHKLREALTKIGPDFVVVGGDVASECLGRHFGDEFWEIQALSDLTAEATHSELQGARVAKSRGLEGMW